MANMFLKVAGLAVAGEVSFPKITFSKLYLHNMRYAVNEANDV